VNVSAARSKVVDAPTPSPAAVTPTEPPPAAAASAAQTQPVTDINPDLARAQFNYDSELRAYKAAYTLYKEDQKRGNILHKHCIIPPISVGDRLLSKHQRKKIRAQSEENKPDRDSSGYASDSDYPSEYDSENDYFRNEDKVTEA
jgi:hypothetical protein